MAKRDRGFAQKHLKTFPTQDDAIAEMFSMNGWTREFKSVAENYFSPVTSFARTIKDKFVDHDEHKERHRRAG